MSEYILKQFGPDGKFMLFNTGTLNKLKALVNQPNQHKALRDKVENIIKNAHDWNRGHGILSSTYLTDSRHITYYYIREFVCRYLLVNFPLSEDVECFPPNCC